jgi:hypothetical protein
MLLGVFPAFLLLDLVLVLAGELARESGELSLDLLELGVDDLSASRTYFGF